MRHAGPTDEEPQVTDARRTRVTKAVIPAAGLGTRFLPATKSTPKEMLPVVDKPAIQLWSWRRQRPGLRDVLMVTGRSKRALEDHFDVAPELERVLEQKDDTGRLAAVRASNDLATVHYVRQGEPLGPRPRGAVRRRPRGRLTIRCDAR